MPPSTIPPDQVQAIIAELRASESRALPPSLQSAEAAHDPWRARTFAAAGLLGVGIVIGIGFGVFGPGFARKSHPAAPPTALVMTTPVRVDTLSAPPTVSVTPTASPRPAATAAAPIAVPAPPKPLVLNAAVTQPALRPPVGFDTVETVKVRPKPCLDGGACGRADVQAAERRLEITYRAAQRNGVSGARLAGVKQRWNGLSAGAQSNPRAAVAGYRKLAAELTSKNAKPAAKPVAKSAKRRVAPAHEAPLPFRRAR